MFEQLGEDPARRAIAVLVVLNRVVVQLHAEPREQLVDVVPVLLLLGLAEHHQPAAATHERLDRLELVGFEARRPRAGGPLPGGFGGMGDHEQVAASEPIARQAAFGMRGDRKIAL